jgi:hypothetical protein
MHALGSRVTIGATLCLSDGSAHMADLAYAVLLIGIFAVLALALRGLERL